MIKTRKEKQEEQARIAVLLSHVQLYEGILAGRRGRRGGSRGGNIYVIYKNPVILTSFPLEGITDISTLQSSHLSFLAFQY